MQGSSMTVRTPVVVSVSRDSSHRFSKQPSDQITLLEGLGVECDAHLGETVQHRSRVAQDPTQPNLRQVHLIQSELFEEVAAAGFAVTPGQLGENITTAGIDLLSLPGGAVLQLGAHARIEITGLRNPCSQINGFEPGLLKAVLGKSENGDVVRKAGIMAVVTRSGVVRPGDAIAVTLPAEPHRALERV
jgi:MOSC domain-containing protein YiiM